MIRPPQKPKWLRRVLYYLSSFSFLKIVENWYLIPLSYLKIINPSDHLIRLQNGLKFNLTHVVDAWAIKEVFADSDYQLRSTGRKFTVVDIGAHIGTFSLFAASLNPHIKVYSFEPSQPTFRALQINILLNNFSNQIYPFRLAVFNKITTHRLYNSGLPGTRTLDAIFQSESFETVKTTTINEIFRINKIKYCDYLKIDCEGAEYSILSSCPPSLFKKVKQVSLEFHEKTPNQNHHQLVDLLVDRGYKVTHKYNPIENTIGYIYAFR